MPSLTLGDWSLIFVITTIMAAAAVCLITWKLAYSDGYHDGKNAEQCRQAQRRLNAAARARDAGRPLPRPSGQPWYVVIEKRTVPLVHGPIRPAAYRQALLTDTGEFRAIAKAGTDLYIEDMQREGSAYRAKITEELRA